VSRQYEAERLTLGDDGEVHRQPGRNRPEDHGAPSQGYTERQIGKVVGMSGPAVHKHIVKMRGVLRELVA